MYRTLFFLSLWLCYASFVSAQTYQYKILDLSGKPDTLLQLIWPATTPSYFQKALCFEEVARLRIHEQEIRIPISDHIVQTKQFNQRHQNVAIYYTPERSNLSNAVLHEFGFATDEIIFNPQKDGFYLTLTENQGFKSSTLFEVTKGTLIRHKTKNCNARITAFPANGKVNRT